jgi:energy-coupling factor transporter ATP-binding protein EcfA2
MSELTPTELLQLTRAAKRNLRYDQPLDLSNPDEEAFLVNLGEARGNFNQNRLLFDLGIDEPTQDLDMDNPQQYILFGGHRGCGKSTELRLLAKKLHKPEFYYVVFIDSYKELDINNLHYSDVLLAQAKVLIQQLEKDNIDIKPVFLTRLEEWFMQKVNTKLTEQQLNSKNEAGIEIKTSLLFLGSLFAKSTNAINYGSSQKEEIREAVRSSYSEFSSAFNALITHVEEQLNAAQKAKKLLFIVDGTDRLPSQEATNFFVRDIHQLKQIHSNFIYCAPIQILSESGTAAQEFTIIRLPMVKIVEKQSADYIPVALEKLSEFVSKRVDLRLFSDAQVTLNSVPYNQALLELLKASGGHVRDLMRLMDYCLAETLGGKKIDQSVTKAAIKRLANEYAYLTQQTDYALLAEIDSKDATYLPTSEQSRRLLYDLVLLEYNSHWWQSHPVVRTLPAYQQALIAYSAANP